MHEATLVGATRVERLLQSVEHARARRACGPRHAAPRASRRSAGQGVEEGDVDKAGPSGDVGEIGHSSPAERMIRAREGSPAQAGKGQIGSTPRALRCASMKAIHANALGTDFLAQPDRRRCRRWLGAAVELCLSKIRRRLAQDLVGLRQLANLTLQGLHPLALVAGHAKSLPRLALGPAHLFASVSALQPIFDAVELIAAHTDACSPQSSNTNRTARARTSGAYLVCLIIAPFPHGLKPPENPERFRRLTTTLLRIATKPGRVS